jgi:hypothetical protein
MLLDLYIPRLLSNEGFCWTVVVTVCLTVLLPLLAMLCKDRPTAIMLASHQVLSTPSINIRIFDTVNTEARHRI